LQGNSQNGREVQTKDTRATFALNQDKYFIPSHCYRV